MDSRSGCATVSIVMCPGMSSSERLVSNHVLGEAEDIRHSEEMKCFV